MAYRLSMVPRIARRFGVHTRPHVITLCAFFSRRIGALCLVVAAAIALSPVPTSLDLPVTPSGGAVTGTADGTVLYPAPPPGSTVRDEGSAVSPVLRVDGGAVERLLAAAGTPLAWTAVGVALVWLTPLLRRFAEGDPFAPGNAGRLRGIAVAALVATHVAPLLTPLATVLALHRLGGSGWSPAWGFPLHTSLVLVLLLFLLAGALDVGRRLQTDSEGLV
ncbi:DUF2975 domain-containing protein [Kineococcus sp. TBRC 1896]|uniref:DUF2975 domain-containing protein n=1 Tax=Kineococcus mangrovi TaxID=1660183 RepID=A0ABV4I293_9ACTN